MEVVEIGATRCRRRKLRAISDMPKSFVMPLETDFDATFVAELALKEKQIQQNYRPIIGVHKWFARRPGSVFRSLLLAEFAEGAGLRDAYWRKTECSGVIADPFMGGGTPLFEANRMGFQVLGSDINPMAWWIVRQSLSPVDVEKLERRGEKIANDVEKIIGRFYTTRCLQCGEDAPVKYFLWVKVDTCPKCHAENRLFPGHVLAENSRHPQYVLTCPECGALGEFPSLPSTRSPGACTECASAVYREGRARRRECECRQCGENFKFPVNPDSGPPAHRLCALEYHCFGCRPHHRGRFFKAPDAEDLNRVRDAEKMLSENKDLPCPDAAIPPGDETNRLLRWGYTHYKQMFNSRQKLGLGFLLQRILKEQAGDIRHALLTVFSDILRYQNMLCRYDTNSLKVQDIFSVHGYPVGLVQCEANLLGTPSVGSGAFRHFIKKYIKAKFYATAPYETHWGNGRKALIPITGENISATMNSELVPGKPKRAWLSACDAADLPLKKGSLDGVFTDPPYFDSVQYAELMDFCFQWLRIGLHNDFKEFRVESLRSKLELTGNATAGRNIEHFAEGLSRVFQHYAAALKPGAPFVFTYHHNDPLAYLPLVVAVLDAGLDCGATLPAVAEMNASIHIAKTKSSVLDSVFVCRQSNKKSITSVKKPSALDIKRFCFDPLFQDCGKLENAGIELREGDLRCLLAGHIARLAINRLRPSWTLRPGFHRRLSEARGLLEALTGTAKASLSKHHQPDAWLNRTEQGESDGQAVRTLYD